MDARQTTPVASRLDVDRINDRSIDAAAAPATAFEMLRRSAAAWPDRVALRFLPDPGQVDVCRELSYTALFDRICRAARLFVAHGAGRDDVIAVALPNLPDAHFAIWGAQAVATVMPVNPAMPDADLAALLAVSAARFLVIDARLWAQVGDVLAAAAPRLEHVFVVGEADALGRPDLTLHDFRIALNREGGAVRDVTAPPPSHTGLLLSTAGTTGRPRLVRRSLAADMRGARALMPMFGNVLNDRSVVAGGLPLFHNAALVASGLLPWSVGASVVTAGPLGFRDPDYVANFWRIVAHYQVTLALLVPEVMSRLLRVPVGDSDISSLLYAICGTSRLPDSLHRRFERAIGIRVLASYGLVEAGCVAMMTPPAGERRAGSAGIAVPWHRTRIAHLRDDGGFGGDCDIDEIGRLLINGPAMCEAYADGDGNAIEWVDCGDMRRWLDTGDIASIDADGYHWIAGRSGEVVRRDGRYLDPATIEEPLLRHPMVTMAAAVARPDPAAGEVPVVYAVLREGGQSDPVALHEFLAEELDDVAYLPDAVVIVDALPLTPLGKVDKISLRRLQVDDAVDVVASAANDAADPDDGA